MNPLNQINIDEKQTVYDITYTYHSDMKCGNFDAKLVGIEESDGRITIKPGDHPAAVGFVFEHSDPDRIIAIAQMILSFAQAMKNENEKPIDISNNTG